MDSTLRERFERLGPIRAVDRVDCGSPAVFVLSLPPGSGILKTIDAAHALAKRGLPLLRAKRAVERLVEDRRCLVELPTVEDAVALTNDLARAGIASAMVRLDIPDVRKLRGRLGLTREQFAVRYGLEIETIRNWETGKRQLDATARSYLQAISNDPKKGRRGLCADAFAHDLSYIESQTNGAQIGGGNSHYCDERNG